MPTSRIEVIGVATIQTIRVQCSRPVPDSVQDDMARTKLLAEGGYLKQAADLVWLVPALPELADLALEAMEAAVARSTYIEDEDSRI